MAGPCAVVYLPPQASEAFVDRVHVLLAETALEIESTRKGHVWDAWFGRGPHGLTVPIHIAVERTTDDAVRFDAEGDLLEAGVTFTDYPWRVLLCAGCNGEEDWQAIRTLLDRIQAQLGGFATEPIK